MAARFKQIKAILIGDSDVGKTSIYNLFDTKVDGSLGTQPTTRADVLTKVMVTVRNHETIELQLFDTAGTEKFNSVMTRFYRNADIALLVYDISRIETFHNITQRWINDVKKYSQNENIKWILLGNKVDLDGYRQVSFDMIQNCDHLRSMELIEMSAKRAEDYSRLDSVIRTTVDEILTEGSACCLHVQEQRDDGQPPEVLVQLQADEPRQEMSRFKKCITCKR